MRLETRNLIKNKKTTRSNQIIRLVEGLELKTKQKNKKDWTQKTASQKKSNESQ